MLWKAFFSTLQSVLTLSHPVTTQIIAADFAFELGGKIMLVNAPGFIIAPQPTIRNALAFGDQKFGTVPPERDRRAPVAEILTRYYYEN